MGWIGNDCGGREEKTEEKKNLGMKNSHSHPLMTANQFR